MGALQYADKPCLPHKDLRGIPARRIKRRAGYRTNEGGTAKA